MLVKNGTAYLQAVGGTFYDVARRRSQPTVHGITGRSNHSDSGESESRLLADSFDKRLEDTVREGHHPEVDITSVRRAANVLRVQTL
jgi:hypothetical protein